MKIVQWTLNINPDNYDMSDDDYYTIADEVIDDAFMGNIDGLSWAINFTPSLPVHAINIGSEAIRDISRQIENGRMSGYIDVDIDDLEAMREEDETQY